MKFEFNILDFNKIMPSWLSAWRAHANTYNAGID